MEKKLEILRNDPWLEPYAEAITGRHEDVIRKMEELTAETGGSLSQFANAYKYSAFIVRKTANGSSVNTHRTRHRYGSSGHSPTGKMTSAIHSPLSEEESGKRISLPISSGTATFIK